MSDSNQWRNTGRAVRFFLVDGRAMIFLLLAIYHISYWTAGLCVVGIVFLSILESKGYTLPNAFRKLTVILIGKNRPTKMPKHLGRSDR